MPREAFSSAVAVILPLCAVSIAVYAAHDSLPLRDALPYLIGGAAGGVLAGLWFRKIPAKALHLILGGVILAGGVRLIEPCAPWAARCWPSRRTPRRCGSCSAAF